MNEEALFAAALDKKTAAERNAYLDQACAGNSELRAQVEELLKADSDAGSFLEHPPVPIDATVESGENAHTSADSGAWSSRLSFLQHCNTPGRLGKLSGKVGEYEIIEIVGHGGMGAVLRAFDTKLSRVVAVKVMAPELAANPVAVKRFLREATTAAAVHHDHVVTIHAVDDAHQPPYLVMQFVEGQTLQQKIDREGPLDLKTILRIGSQAAAGLAAAHKTGLIHRDVKPSNILLENGVERVKISDFGLARAADDLQVTQTGIIAGTPQYMSPEQAKGEPIDARSDLFSLGSVLYTMCTGRPAFRADNPIAVLRRVIDDAPRPIHEINAEIPSWLEDIVNRLLAKNPNDRFQTAAEVAELLGQHLAHVQNPSIAPLPAPVAFTSTKSEVPSESIAQATQSTAPVWIAGVGGLVFALVGLLGAILKEFSLVNGRVLGLTLVILEFSLVLAFTVWFIAKIANHQKQTRATRQNEIPAKPSKLTARGIFIEHPVLGLLAIVMLITSASIATYMLTSAVLRKRAKDLAAFVGGHMPSGVFIEIKNERGTIGRFSGTGARSGVSAGKYQLFISDPIRRAGGQLTLERFDSPLGFAKSLRRSGDSWEIELHGGDRAVIGVELPTAVTANSDSDNDWVQLFNGKDLTGWKTHPDQPGKWVVKDGVLTCSGGPSHLYSERNDYADFQLRVEARINSTGNSGIFFRAGDKPLVRVQGPSVPAPAGYEVQIFNDPPQVTGTLYVTQENGRFTTLMRPLTQYAKAGQWFTLEVEAHGNIINRKINGTPLVGIVQDATFTRGHLALQHSTFETKVEFRKIEVKELLPGATAGRAPSAEADDRSNAPVSRITGWGSSWSPDSRFLVRKNTNVRLPAVGPLEIVDIASGANRHLIDFGKDPVWSPQANGPIAFVQVLPDFRTEIWLVNPDGSQPRRISDGCFVCGWSADGSRLYDFDLNTSRIRSINWSQGGAPFETLATLSQIAAAFPSISPDGRLIAFAGFSGGDPHVIVRETATGKVVAAATVRGWDGVLVGWSPDSKHVGYGDFGGGNVGLWMLDVETGQARKILNGPYTMPRWSPDGQWIAVDDRNTREILIFKSEDLNGASSTVATRPASPPGATAGSSSSASSEWTQLFNGRDLTGWKTLPEQPGTWKVEDGVLVGSGGISHLFSDKTYGDFQLRVEARLIRGDSGIFFRSELGLPKVSKITGLKYPSGYEAEIVDPKSDHGQGNTGSIRPLALVLDDLVPLGEWFNIDVTADGNHLVTKVNGRIAADVHDSSRQFTSGHLVLGCGGSGLPTIIQFRKIEVKELSSDSDN